MSAQGRRLYRLLVAWRAGGPQPTPKMLSGTPAVARGPLEDPRLEDRARSLQMFIGGLAVNGLICPGK